jgi:hypothetical protein
LREEAQTLFTVVAMTVLGMPAPMAHWRAGPWPRLMAVSFWETLEAYRFYLPSGENIAEEDLLDSLRGDASTLNSTWRQGSAGDQPKGATQEG